MSLWKIMFFFALGTLVGCGLNLWSYRLRPKAVWRGSVVVMSTGLLFASIAVSSGVNLRTAVLLVFLSAIIGASLVDIDQKIIPDRITLPGTLFGLAASALIQDPPFLYAALGVVTGGGLILLMALVGRVMKGQETIGGGDIKLAAMLGAFLGWKLTVVAIVLSLLTGSTLAVALIRCERKIWGEPLPFGPFLASGGIAALFWGNNLFDWYLHLLRN